MLSFFYPSFAAVTSVEVRRVGVTGQYIEAGTTGNPVLHFKITAPGGDTLTDLSVMNILNSWYVGAAEENSTIAADGIKVWYSTVDTNDFSASSPVYVTHLPRDISDGTWWHNNFSQAVSDGSHIWVTADIQSSPAYGTMEMQTENLVFAGSGVTSVNAPANPFVLLITSVSPAISLDVLHEPGSIQSTVSTMQSYVTPMELKFFNNSPDTAADITINSLTLKIQTYPAPGTILSPSSILSAIRLQDKDQGTIYGELLSGSIPSAAAPFAIPVSQISIPAGTTTTVSVIISLTADPASADTEFVISIDSDSDIEARDYYTVKRVPVQASPFDTTDFPMHSKQSKIQKKLGSLNAWFTKILPEPQNINKGATNVELLKIGLENSGDTNTASAEVYNLKIYTEDGSGASLVPRDLFSKISVTDESGTVKYRVKSYDAIETSGNTINFSFSLAPVVAYASRITLVVRADISSSTIVNSFRLKLASGTDISCRDKNSLAFAAVYTGALPFYSSLALLTSSFTVSHSSLMPSNIYKGQSGIHVMDLVMSSPLSFGSGNILVRGISLTAKNSSGQDILLSSVLSDIRLTASNQSVSFALMPSAATGYFAFPYDVTITALTGETVAVYAGIKNNASPDSVRLLLPSEAAISAYQDNDPLRQIFIAPGSSGLFPLSSGTGYIGGTTSGLSFSVYPAPFNAALPCVLGYYLSTAATVTISVYDMTGSHIKTLVKNAAKAAGSHSEDSWDGKDSNNRTVLSGVYLVKIDAGSLGTAAAKAVFIK